MKRYHSKYLESCKTQAARAQHTDNDAETPMRIDLKVKHLTQPTNIKTKTSISNQLEL
jgi:hypothetical protein